MSKLKPQCLVPDVPKIISKHLIGKEHQPKHHMLVGGVIMIGGVIMAITASVHSSVIVHIVGDLIGYALHGIGLVPFIKNIGLEA